MFYEGMRAAITYGRRKWSVIPAETQKHEFSSFEELIMGGTAGGSPSNSFLLDVHLLSGLSSGSL